MGTQNEKTSDLNRVAIQEFRKLVEADKDLSAPWRDALLRLTKDEDAPASLAELETLVRKEH